MAPLHNADAPSLAVMFDHRMHWWVEDLGTELEKQMLGVSRYLFDAKSPATTSTPARTAFPWQLLVTRIGEVIYRLLAAGTAKPRRLELARILALWSRTGFVEHRARVRVIEMTITASLPELTGLDAKHPDRLVTWHGNRYFARYDGVDKRRLKLIAIEVGSPRFRIPPTAKITSAVAAETRFDATAIATALELAESRGRVPFAPVIAQRIAAATKLSRAAATLLWAAGYDPWLAGAKKLARFGIDRRALDRAELELVKYRLREVYADAMPDDPAALYDPAIAVPRLVSAFKALAKR